MKIKGFKDEIKVKIEDCAIVFNAPRAGDILDIQWAVDDKEFSRIIGVAERLFNRFEGEIILEIDGAEKEVKSFSEIVSLGGIQGTDIARLVFDAFAKYIKELRSLEKK